MALTPAEKQRAYRERLKVKAPATSSLIGVSGHLASLTRLIDATYGKRLGTMERRAMMDEIVAIRRACGG